MSNIKCCCSKKILMVIAPKNFQNEELFIPMEYFKEKGAQVEIASIGVKVASGHSGKTADVDLDIKDVKIEDYDAIAIAGGGGSREYLWKSSELIDIVKSAFDMGKVIGAICLSPAVLAKAGLLKNKKSTIYPDDEAIKVLKENGGIYENESVVVSGNIVTGRDPDSALEYAQLIWDKMAGK